MKAPFVAMHGSVAMPVEQIKDIRPMLTMVGASGLSVIRRNPGDLDVGSGEANG